MNSIRLVDLNGLKEAYGRHLEKYLLFDDEMIQWTLLDFEDPYDYCYCDCRYLKDTIIDGENYEIRAYWIDFSRWFGRPDFSYWFLLSEKDKVKIKSKYRKFCFYVYFKIKDGFESTVVEYKDAEKLYQIEGVDEDDCWSPYY